MKVADLVLRLQQLPPHAEVLAFDPDTGLHEPITGYTAEDGARRIELHTDDMNVERSVVMIDSHTFVALDRGHIVALVTAADIINPFRAALQGLDSACPAAGMKPDACSDRSQCLEACGPHGQAAEIPHAVATLHAPNGIVHACEHHASTARLQASFLGSHAYVDEAPAGTPCTYCATKAKGGA